MRRIVRWLCGRVDWTSERGGPAVGILAGLVTLGVVAIYVGVPLVCAAYQDLRDVYSGKWNAKQPTVIIAGGTAPFIGPALPADPNQAACVVKAARAAGLTYGSNGWEAPSVYPRPDPGSRQGTFDAWADQVRSYYQARQDEWANCLKANPPSEESTTTSEATLSFLGTYNMTYTDVSSSPCSLDLPPTITVGGTAASTTFNGTTLEGEAYPLTGSVDSSYSFSANGTANLKGADANHSGIGPVALRMLGRFSVNGSSVTIQNGSLSFTGNIENGSCSEDFTATKQ